MEREENIKNPQFYHVCEVVEVCWHTPLKEIPIKTTEKKLLEK